MLIRVCELMGLIEFYEQGGTLATIMSLFDKYSISEMKASLDPFVLSPNPPSRRSSSRGLLSRIFGPFSYPELGQLTTSMTASGNVPVVHRSSALMPQLYGNNFRYEEYLHVSNYAWGVAIHLGFAFASVILALSPVRNFIRRFIYQPGQGPTVEDNAKDILECRAVAIAD